MQHLKAKEAREFFNENPEPLEFLIWEDMKADGTVYVPSRMPVRAELKKSDRVTSPEEQSSGSSSESSSKSLETQSSSSSEGAMMQNESNNQLLDEPDENNASSKSAMKLSNLSPQEKLA